MMASPTWIAYPTISQPLRCTSKFDGVLSALRADSAQHEAVLRDALSQYNSNKNYWQAPQITRTYVDIGLRWWRENSALIPVYLRFTLPAHRRRHANHTIQICSQRKPMLISFRKGKFSALPLAPGFPDKWRT